MPISTPTATSVMWCMPRNMRDQATNTGIATTSDQRMIRIARFWILEARTISRPPNRATEAAVCPEG